jgi:hypothetical protein
MIEIIHQTQFVIIILDTQGSDSAIFEDLVKYNSIVK